MIGKLFSALNKECLEISKSKVSSINLAGIIYRQDDGTLSSKTAEELFFILWKNDTADLDELILANDLSQIRDETGLVTMIEDVLDKNCKMVEQYLAGKEKALNALVGQVMKLSKGKANAQLVKEKILEKISKD
jgi:aspartyl-tRNA(Asn)/glutamyl-tRNA(Gln) amidotransferase subunit B